MTAQRKFVTVNVITGFLGSGKTTVLQKLLTDPGMKDTAVLINEFGEVGLDHHLLERIDDDTVVLQSGCICCTIRGDLAISMRDLLSRRDSGEVPHFSRLVIETTGLADPAPIVYTLTAEDVLRHHFRLGNVVTTVDAVNGAKQLKRNDECRKQAAVADRIVLTKMDMLAEKDCVEDADTLIAQLKRLNPSAPHFDSQKDELTAAKLFTNDVYDPRAKSAEVARWIDAEAFTDGIHAHDDDTGAHAHDNVNRHDGGIHAFCLTFDTPLDWTAFGLWLSALLQNHGEEVLRVKGLLNVVDVAAPVAIHGVQHVVHPPIHLNRWPDSDRRSRIVFIVRDLAEDQIRASLIAFNQLGDIASKQVAA